MQERFEDRTLKGEVNVACKFENQPTRYWITDKRNVVDNIIKIVNRYIREGETLTLRQLHYQFVGHVPGYVNHDSAYKKLGDILDDLRYCGVVPWNSFEDRGRKPYLPYSVKDIPDALKDTVETYRINRQEGQMIHVELWTEKDALSAIFSKITSEFHVRLVINKGYTSSTAAYEAYRRVVGKIKEGRKVVVLYFGDHDPSGLDMVRDIKERIMFFLSHGQQLDFLKGPANSLYEKEFSTCGDICVYYDREALANRLMNFDKEARDKDVDEFHALKVQYYIEQLSLFQVPENPTKLTDSRAVGYIKQFGKKCWEVDAIDLVELRRILREAIEGVIDLKLFKKVVARENKEIKELKSIVDKFNTK
jgi:hypothetical protein